MKKYYHVIYYCFLIIYLEVITKLLAFKNINSLFLTLLFSIPIIIFLDFITSLFSPKINKIISYVITTIISVYFGYMTIFYRLFSNIFSLNTLSLAENIGEFKNMIIDVIIKNLFIIFLYLIPLIILIIFRKRIIFKKVPFKENLTKILTLLLIHVMNLIIILPTNNDLYSPYNLYYKINSEIKTASTFGMITYGRIDLKRVIFGFDEHLIIDQTEDNNEKNISPEISYNKLDINFNELINNSTDQTVKKVLSYFNKTEATKKNDYTGMFKGKNLIFILAESFNEIAVDENITPTLYKLTHSGFSFSNYYSPMFLSTTGGEFQAMTGLIPTQETLNIWKKDTPNIKYALGNSLSKLGYETFSYHDWTYTYYNRDKTMPTLGFNKYSACGNGMEHLINCDWLPSDLDMIKSTLPLYKDSTPFVSYYVTVSGHGPYIFNKGSNSIAVKNESLVKDLPYSSNVVAYLAGEIELDKALEALINGLDEAGILDDTVIALSGDHYPYYLTLDEVNELSTYEKDDTIEVNHSNLIIWNSAMKENINIEKVGTQIDILPTLLNLFGVDYDSRLIVGKDILSDTPGLAIFSNRSWVSDYGTYKNGTYTSKKDLEMDEKTYIDSINLEVNNRFTISSNIMKTDIYDYIFK